MYECAWIVYPECMRRRSFDSLQFMFSSTNQPPILVVFSSWYTWTNFALSSVFAVSESYELFPRYGMIDKLPSYLFQSHLRVVLPTVPAIARFQGMAKLERVCMDFLWAKMVKGETKSRERHESLLFLLRQENNNEWITRNNVHDRVYDELKRKN